VNLEIVDKGSIERKEEKRRGWKIEGSNNYTDIENKTGRITPPVLFSVVSLPYHHLSRLDDRGHVVAGFEFKIVDRILRYQRSDDISTAISIFTFAITAPFSTAETFPLI
jgi:hypothetical protein